MKKHEKLTKVLIYVTPEMKRWLDRQPENISVTIRALLAARMRRDT